MHANGAAPPPAVASKRMTYGAYSMQNREGRDRQELFSGAGPYGHQQQQEMSMDEMNNAQLMQQAVEQHRDTTATAKRALQVLEQTKEIQGNAQAALEDQRQQMGRIEHDLDKMGQDLSYSERLLRFMKLCCCVGFCCSCCTEPGARNKSDQRWRGPAPSHDPYTGPSQKSMGNKQQMQQMRQAGTQPPNGHLGSNAYPTVNTHGLDEIGFGDQAAVIDAETQQQNQYLDEISKGLDQLKFGAQRMHEELRYQESHADRIREDADELQLKLHSVNRQGFKNI